jgi:hypothetical protein
MRRRLWSSLLASPEPLLLGSVHVPKRNFGFEKRQKELNKQRKREEKQQRKLDRAATADAEKNGESPPADDLVVEE